MENSPNIHDDLFEVSFDYSAKESLKAAASWAKIIAILGFVSYGITLLAAVLGKAQTLKGFSDSASDVASTVYSIVTVVIGVAITIFLFKFAQKTAQGINQLHQGSLEEGFSALRYYFKIQGILLIIVIAFVFLVVILAVVSGGFR